jgi:hypothetical protein
MSQEQRRVVALGMLSCLLLAVGVGCGPQDDSGVDSTATSAPSSTAVDDASDDVTQRRTGASPNVAQVAVTQASLARGRELDALTAAWAPVTARVSAFTAAVTLAADAVTSGEQPLVLEQRRIALVRERAALSQALASSATPLQRASDAATGDAVLVAALLEQSRAARTRAIAQLDLRSAEALVLTLADAAPWRTSWDTSVRAAREATAAVQQQRASAGLAPAPEEAIR